MIQMVDWRGIGTLPFRPERASCRDRRLGRLEVRQIKMH